jgi:hypothetical protein
LVLVSCEIGSGLGSRIKLFFPKFLTPLRNLRPFLFVFSSLDRTPREKWHDPLTTRCPMRCYLQSLQGERESKIGERKPGWFWDNLKIIFKRSKLFFLFLKTNNLWRKMKNVLK